MARPQILQEDFSLGMRQDTPREQLPKGTVWSMVDWLPERGAPLVKRGGWRRPFSALSASTDTYVAAVGFAPFTAGSKVVAITDTARLFYAAPGAASMSLAGAADVPPHPPTFYDQNLYVTDINGTSLPTVFNGTTVASITASAPTGALSAVYKDHLVLARSAANTNRVWFSNGGDANTWNTGANGQWIDATSPIQGMAALRNTVVLFQEGFTERITGSVIPGNTASDMAVQPLFNVGCSDPASVAVAEDYCVFANSNGVYMTDGSSVIVDLTEQGGISQLWQTLLSGYANTWVISGALFKGRYHVSVMNGSTFVAAFICDVRRRVWSRLTNVKAWMLATSPVGILDFAPLMYMAERGSLNVGELSTMYTPSATYKNDGDGTAVTPTLELPHYIGKPGRKRWRNIYAKYYMTDAATDNPVLTVSYQTDLASSSYTAVGTTLAENTSATRQRIPISSGTSFGGLAAEGVSLRIAQTNASAVTHLYRLESEINPMEQSRS